MADSTRTQPQRRASDMLRDRALTLLLGLALGGLSSTALLSLTMGQRLAVVETQLSELSKRLDRNGLK